MNVPYELEQRFREQFRADLSHYWDAIDGFDFESFSMDYLDHVAAEQLIAATLAVYGIDAAHVISCLALYEMGRLDEFTRDDLYKRLIILGRELKAHLN